MAEEACTLGLQAWGGLCTHGQPRGESVSGKRTQECDCEELRVPAGTHSPQGDHRRHKAPGATYSAAGAGRGLYHVTRHLLRKVTWSHAQDGLDGRQNPCGDNYICFQNVFASGVCFWENTFFIFTCSSPPLKYTVNPIAAIILINRTIFVS